MITIEENVIVSPIEVDEELLVSELGSEDFICLIDECINQLANNKDDDEISRFVEIFDNYSFSYANAIKLISTIAICSYEDPDNKDSYDSNSSDYTKLEKIIDLIKQNNNKKTKNKESVDALNKLNKIKDILLIPTKD